MDVILTQVVVMLHGMVYCGLTNNPVRGTRVVWGGGGGVVHIRKKSPVLLEFRFKRIIIC